MQNTGIPEKLVKLLQDIYQKPPRSINIHIKNHRTLPDENGSMTRMNLIPTLVYASVRCSNDIRPMQHTGAGIKLNEGRAGE